jgi:hypothetical protein
MLYERDFTTIVNMHHHWLDSPVWDLTFLPLGFGDKSFFWLGLSTLQQPPAILEDRCFSVSVFSLS